MARPTSEMGAQLDPVSSDGDGAAGGGEMSGAVLLGSALMIWVSSSRRALTS